MHNVRVSVPRFLLVCAVLGLASGCGWDGPPAAVRVVPPDSVPAQFDDAARVIIGSDVAGDAAGGLVGAPSGDDGAGEAAGTESEPPGNTFDAQAPLPSTVAVVGDSLTLSADREIEDALTAMGLEVLALDGVESRRMTAGSSSRPSGLDAIEQIRDDLGGVEPELWVIALGTNDVGAQVDSDRFRTDVRGTLAGLPSSAPVVWVDVWIRDRSDGSAKANRVIRAELAARAAPSSVVDWYANGDVDGVITGDGVHLTELGRVTFADAITAQIRTLYGR